MGDRGNIVIEKDNQCFESNLYFYTHWSGSEIKETLQAALIRGKGRWSDPAYLARIIFSEMIQGSVMEETGFGISTRMQDNEHDLLWINIPEKKVTLRNEDGVPKQTWTFQEFITDTDTAETE